MRRIAITVTVLALVAGAFGCSSDAPTPPKSGGPGGGQGPTGSTALQIRLFTSNPNPPAGTCTLIQAIVTLNGASVPDGTGVVFSTDFGVFAQNGLPLISVTTQNGAAVTALCSEFPGTAVVRATSTVGSETGSATITIAFQQAAAGAGPFISFCDPSFGPNTGGTALALHGGRFCPTSGCTGNEAANARVVFFVNGVAREATVTSVTNDVINVLTPGFPEVTSPTTPVEIRVTLNNNTATPTVLSLPNCFAFGTTLPTTPTITAVLPASGVNEGNTRVTIIGSGFDSEGGVQVFFGEVEATIVSVSFNQIVVLTPPAFGSGRDNLNQQVAVRVRNIRSGQEATLAGGYRYTQPVQIIALSGPNLQRVDQPFTPVTIHGHGFQAPVAVTLAGWAATVLSVSESELVVLPGRPLLQTGCNDVTGPVVVTNIDTGNSASGLSFTYLVAITKPVIVSISPRTGPPGTVMTITGFNLPPSIADAFVEIGGRLATVTAASSTELTVIVPDLGLAAPLCPPGTATGTPVNVGGAVAVAVTSRFTTCTTSSASAFQPQVECVVPTPTPSPTSLTPQPTGTQTPTAGPTPTPTPAPADLTIAKTDSPDPVVSGTTLTYTIIVTNNGPGFSLGVNVTDPLPVGTTFISCNASQGSCSGPSVGSNGTVTANFGTVGFPGFATLSIAVNVTAPPSVVLTNVAVVTSATPDTNNGNNTSTTTTTVSGAVNADLGITKTDAPDPVGVGGNISYTITVNNAGPATAANVVVSDVLPTGTTFVSCVPSVGSCAGPPPGSTGTVTADLGTIPSLGSATINLVVNVNAGAGSVVSNTATVSSPTADSNLANNSATATTSVTTAAATDLSIAKSDSPDPVLSGGSLTYTVTVDNLGAISATNVEVSDPLPSGTTFQSCVSSVGVCTGPAVGTNGTVHVTIGTLAPADPPVTITIGVNVVAPPSSTLTNTATVLSSTPDSNSANNSASATTTVSP
jgi:uncharacterized repeat protein (TIGR01451 family)